jgi:hypothetical protein
MRLVKRRRVPAILTLALVLTLVPTGLGGAATKSCKSPGRAVIRQTGLVVYLVTTGGRAEYRGCDRSTGRVTRLITRGRSLDAEQVVAHGRHATVAESGPYDPASPTVTKVVTLWDLSRGRTFSKLTIDAADEPTRPSPQLFDSPSGDPVTAVLYLQEDGTRVLQALTDKGTRKLSSASVTAGSVNVTGRTVSWTEGTRKRTRRL